MAGAGKAIAVLAGVVVLGVGAALWMGLSSSAPEAQGETKDVAEAPAKGGEPKNGARSEHPHKLGTASVVGEVRRTKGKAAVVDQVVELRPERGEAWTAHTDPEGKFVLDKIPHGGPYELVVAEKGSGTIHVP